MTSSGISSAEASPAPRSFTPPSPSARSSFALTGPSVKLDPRTHALRGDLADIRLADRVFAPHYAVPMPCAAARPVTLFAVVGGERVANLAAGDLFDLLELAGNHAWGTARATGLVGYCDRTALECV